MSTETHLGAAGLAEVNERIQQTVAFNGRNVAEALGNLSACCDALAGMVAALSAAAAAAAAVIGGER